MNTRRTLTAALCAVLLAVGLLPLFTQPHNAAAAPEQQGSRLVLAFYYAWYDDSSWGAGKVPDFPAPRYVSRDRAAIERHVAQAQGAGIDALVQSWYGPANPTDENFVTLLDVANSKGFKVAVDFEVASPYYGSRAAMVEGLRHLINNHANSPAYLRWNGKPVIFFWRQQQYSVADWSAIRREVDPNRSTLWVAEGVNEAYLAEFDAHHLYSVAWSADPASQLIKWGNRVRAAERQYGDKLWVATAMPGYDDTRLPRSDAFRRDRANGNYYRETFRGANESGADWVVITSFNEFPEGTYIEPSEAYGDFYLNLTRDLAAQFKAGSAPPPSAPPAPSAPQVPAPQAPPAPGTAEWAIPGGRFFTQTGGGQGGFSVTDDGQARFWSEFQRLGGLQTVGYPVSRRYMHDGFVTQAFQKLVLQWRPESSRAVPVNVFDELSKSGFDGTLLEHRQTPTTLDSATFDPPGANWTSIVAGRHALLNANNAIRARYFAMSDPLTVFGLPTSPVEDMGNHYALRTQRAVFQQWKETVPWAQAGQVTIANGGAIAQELGWLPAEAVQPESIR